jgi:hypothetical protein
MSETSIPWTITVGRRRKSDLGKPLEYTQQGFFFRCVGSAPPSPRPPVPDAEVIARPQRRHFRAEYKRSILDEADAAHDSGAIGALLMLHYGSAGAVIEQRQKVLDDAYTRTPERFVRASPKHPPIPTAVWINPPMPTPSNEKIRH